MEICESILWESMVSLWTDFSASLRDCDSPCIWVRTGNRGNGWRYDHDVADDPFRWGDYSYGDRIKEKI